MYVTVFICQLALKFKNNAAYLSHYEIIRIMYIIVQTVTPQFRS